MYKIRLVSGQMKPYKFAADADSSLIQTQSRAERRCAFVS